MHWRLVTSINMHVGGDTMHITIFILILTPSKRCRKHLKKFAVKAIKFILKAMKQLIKKWY